MVQLSMAIALLGIVMAGVGCTSTTPQARVADEVAALLGLQVATDLAAEGADPIQVLWRAVDQLDPPRASTGSLRAEVARPAASRTVVTGPP